MDCLNPMNDLPLGLSMALARNADAMTYFASLSPDDQRRVIDGTHRLHSKAEMQAYVSALGGGELPPAL